MTSRKSKSRRKTKTKAKAESKPKAKTRAAKKAGAKKTASSSKRKPASTEKKTTRKKSAKMTSGSTKAESKKKTATTSKSGRQKMLPRTFLMELCSAIRAAIQPAIAGAKGREVVGTAATSGDATFELDRIAEKSLLSFLRSARMPVAYYSEDSGYTTFTSGQPQNLLIVDPIDGSRAAKSGFEACVVCVATTRVIERPRIDDVDNACVMEVLGEKTFYAERGKGARVYVDGRVKRPKLSSNTNLETISWSMTVPARPAELIFPTAARLIDLSSLKGGFFACNSTSYSLTRLLSNQFDACVDFANRYYRDIPDIVEDQFINAGRGIVLGIAPYDLAASLLIAQEAGCVVTDAYGQSFDEVLLLDSSVGNQRSMIAASNSELHGKLMDFFDTRMNQFEQLLKRRAGVDK